MVLLIICWFSLKFASKGIIFLHLKCLFSVKHRYFSLKKTAVKTKIHIKSSKIFGKVVGQIQDLTRDIFKILPNIYNGKFCENIRQVLVPIALSLKNLWRVEHSEQKKVYRKPQRMANRIWLLIFHFCMFSTAQIMRKYEFLLTRILRFDLRFCPYKGAYGLLKNRIFP